MGPGAEEVASIGRSAELAELQTAAVAVLAGDSVAQVIIGPPGIGKSTIARDHLASLTEWSVLVARCPPPPSAPRRALTDLAVEALAAGASTDAVAGTVFAAAADALLRPSSTAVGEHADAVVAEALRRLLQSCPVQPLLVLVEDLHWADEETAAVLGHLVDRKGDGACQFLMTARPTESRAFDLTVEDWHKRRVAAVIRLRSLDQREVGQLIRRVVGAAAPPMLVQRVVDASDGNPFLVEEFARHALDTGVLVADPGGVRYDEERRLGVPPSYRAAVSRRVNRIGAEVRPAIQLAALCGRELDAGLLVELGVSEDLAQRAVDAAVEGHLGEPGPPARFRHELTRDAVAWTVTDATRRELAAAALDALRRRGDLDDSSLAVASRLAAATGDGRRAWEHLIEAARRAVAGGAPSTALARLDEADEVAPPDLRYRPDARKLRAEALALSGRAAEATAIGEELLGSIEDDVLRESIVVALARAAGAAQNWVEAAGRLDAEFTPESASADVAAVRALAAIEIGDIETARVYATLAVEHGGDTPARCEAHEVLGRIERETSYAAAAVHFRAAIDTAERAGLPLWRARALLELGLGEATMFGRADVFEAASEAAIESGAISLAAMADYNLSNLLTFRFDDRSVEIAERAEQAASTIGAHKLAGMGAITRAQGHAVAGRRALAQLAVDDARRHDPDDPELAGMADGALGLAALVGGDFDSAVGAFASAMRALSDLPVRTATAPWYFGPIILAAAGDEIAPVLRDHLATRAFSSSPFLAASVELMDAIAAGGAGRGGEARTHKSAADRIFATNPGFAGNLAAPRHLLTTVWARAALADAWASPTDELRAAEGFFRDRGLEDAEGACRSLLRGAGVGPRTRGRTRAEIPDHLVPYGVTAREVDVLRLLANRLTNREIADKLTVAPSTVKSHVERLLAKTGRRSRVELAELAQLESDL